MKPRRWLAWPSMASENSHSCGLTNFMGLAFLFDYINSLWGNFDDPPIHTLWLYLLLPHNVIVFRDWRRQQLENDGCWTVHSLAFYSSRSRLWSWFGVIAVESGHCGPWSISRSDWLQLVFKICCSAVRACRSLRWLTDLTVQTFIF